jgi:hypothetical protein
VAFCVMPGTRKIGSNLKEFFKDNSLSIALGALFVFAFGGEMFTGWNNYNDQQTSHHEPAVSLGSFLTTGTFLDGTLCNWQAAILQLAVLIVFSEEFYQRGASHSRKSQKRSSQQANSHHSNSRQSGSNNGGRERRHKERHNWVYRNSLALVFWALFLVLFALHLIFGAKAYNESRATEHLSPMNLWDFATSGKFWFLTLQTWEAEFFAIVVFVVLTIFLRQERSPESKSPDASNKSTGAPNE